MAPGRGGTVSYTHLDVYKRQVLVPASVTDSREVYAAVAGAGRSLGYVNAPSLFQQVTSLCCDLTSCLLYTSCGLSAHRQHHR